MSRNLKIALGFATLLGLVIPAHAVVFIQHISTGGATTSTASTASRAAVTLSYHAVPLPMQLVIPPFDVDLSKLPGLS